MNVQTNETTSRRILLVEDERAARETLRQLLVADGHNVVEANNGAEAFALFLGGKFDLVVTDFEIPFVKGDELARKIKRVNPRQLVLMITAFDHKPGFTNPVDSVLDKPFSAQRFLQATQRLLSQIGQEPADPNSKPEVVVSSGFEKEPVSA